jgi:galactonate dehydratase
VKITAVKGFPLRLGYRSSFIVKVETDEGVAGIGEGGMSGRELAMQGMLEHFAQILIGKDPRQIEHLWQMLYRSYYFEGGKIAGAVISAIDIALHDILGQMLGVPIYQLLGGACRERIQGFETPGILTGPECVTRAEEFVARGWRYLRFNIGMPDPGWGEDDGAIFEPRVALDAAAHWIREVRRSVGSTIELSVELHHRCSVAEAAMFCQKVADVHLMFVEEPIRAQSPEAYAQLRSMTPMPFAVGEEFANKWEFLPYIERGLLNFARIDIANIGGFTEAKKVAGWCEAHYIDVMPHNPLGPVCTAATLHLCAAINNFAQVEYRGEKVAQFPRDLFPVFPEIDGDHFALPTQPGLGVTLEEEAIARYGYDTWSMPQWQRRDGAYTNW